MSLLYLLPGGVSAVAASTTMSPPLGAMLVTQTSHWCAERDLPVLATVHQASPWAPLAVVVDSQYEPATFRLMALVLGGGHALEVRPREEEPLIEAIRSCVRARGAPSRQEFLSYLRVRLGDSMALSIASALDRDDRRTLRGAFQRAGLMSPKAWRDLFHLVTALGSSWETQSSQAAAAAKVQSTTPTLSRQCRARLGMSWRALKQLGIWEAVCEVGLQQLPQRVRRGGLSEPALR